MRRSCSLLVAAAVAAAIAPVSPVRAAPAAPPAGPPAAAPYVDLGVVDQTFAGVKAINDEGDALIHDSNSNYGDGYGRWHNETLTAPQPVMTDCGETGYYSVDLTPDGGVVGAVSYGNTEGSCIGTVGWSQGTLWGLGGASPQPWPELGPEVRPGCGYVSEVPQTVDADGRVGGAGEFNARDTKAGNGCANTVDDQGLLAPEDGSSISAFPALTSIDSLSRHWAVSSSYARVGLSSGARTSLSGFGAMPDRHAVADDGTVVGAVSVPGTYNKYAAYLAPTGSSITPLSLPADAKSGGSSGANSTTSAINGAGEIIGSYDNTAGEDQQLFWPSATSDPVVLDSSLVLPDGWSLRDVTAISSDGLIGGTATDGDGNFHNIEFRAGRTNDLSATVTVADPNGNALTGATSAKGKSAVATVTLTASGTAPEPVTGVTATLVADPGGKLTQTSSTGPPSGGYTLQPGQSVSYQVSYTITGTGGVTLTVTATGTEGDVEQDATAQQKVLLSQPLQVDLAFSQQGTDLAAAKLGPNTIKLADDDKGELSQVVTVTVTVTNTSGAEQDDVSLQDPDLSVVDPATNHDPFPANIAANGALTIGTMPAGDVEKKSFTMIVTGNQNFHVSQLVLSSDPTLGDTEKSLGAGNLTALPTALVLVDDQPDKSTPSHITTGRLVQFDGTVTNLSNTQTLDLDAVLAKIVGNGGGVTKADKAVPTPDGFTAPVTGKVAPGDKATFHVLVQTMPNAGTRATVSFAPTGNVVQADGTEAKLTSEQIRLTAGTSPYLLHLDDSVAAPEQAPDASTAAYIFTASALAGLRDWAANGFHSVAGLADIGTIGDGVVAAGGIVANNVQTDYELVSVIKAELALHVFWAVLTPAQKSAFAEQVAIDTDAASDSFKQFHGAVSAGALSYFQTFQNDFQSGNTVAAYRDFGHGLGSGVPEALSLLVPDVILGKVARGLGWGVTAGGAIAESTVARAISLGAKLKESRIAIGTAKALDGVLAGDNLLANGAKVLKKSFGLAQRDIDIFTNLAKRRNLLVAVRQRNPISTAWLKTGKFLPKSELLKIKNVDAIDVEFLGYRGKGGPLGRGDYGTVVFKEPDTLSEVVHRLRANRASPDVRKAVLKRFEQREEEWRDYRKLYEEYNNGTKAFDVGFDKKAQGAGGKIGKVRDVRKFHLDEITGASKRKYYRVQYADKAGVLKFVTGDIDIVAILNADGSLPSAAVRALLYDDLAKAVGMQHGDTFAWLKDGELFSKTQAKLLSDHLPGNEQLAVFGPDGGCLAGYFDPKLTVFNTVTHDAYATFVGAYSTPLQKIARYTSLKLAGIK